MLTDERNYSFHGLHSKYRTGDTHDVLGMLCAYLIDKFPGGELKRSLCITRVASTLVTRTEIPQGVFQGHGDYAERGRTAASGEEKKATTVRPY